MKIFVDTADLEEITEALETGIVEGVTTNPSLVAKSLKKLREQGKRMTEEELMKEIVSMVGDTRPVSIEVVGFTPEEADAYESVIITVDRMVEEGRKKFEAYNGHGNAVIKIPICPAYHVKQRVVFDAGLQAIVSLAAEGIPVNTTLIFNPMQAFAAAQAGAKYVSPFAGRVDDYLADQAGVVGRIKTDYYPREGMARSDGRIVDLSGVVSGTDLVDQTVRIFSNYGLGCEVLAASLRNVRQFQEMMVVGADIATVPLDVVKDVSDAQCINPLTFKGMQGFAKDAAAAYKLMREMEKKD